MPSRADIRIALERAARAAALVALGALLWRRWEPAAPAAASREVASTAALTEALTEATRRPVPRLSLAADRIPERSARDWLAALARAGTLVRWSASPSVRPVAATLEPIADPAGRARLTIVAPPGTTVTARDGGGLLDSAIVGASGVRQVEGDLTGVITASAPGVSARTPPAESLALRPVLVVARAGWEGKFTVAALEEAGWRVESRLTVAPGAIVSQGGGASIDTSRYSAVVVLDESAAVNAPAIVRFVRAGGGVVIAGDAARVASLAAIRPARITGDTLAAALGALVTDAPRRGLAAASLRPTDADAVVVERRGAAPVVVAARAGLGRVVVSGYADSWRWRMQGGEGSDAAHRAWWSSLVASVALAPSPVGTSASARAAADPAPYAAMVAAFGAPSARGESESPVPAGRADALLFALALAGLLAEWASRRTRGAR